MTRLSTSLAAVLPACAVGGADGNWDAHKDVALDVSPLVREIAASDTFLACKAHPRVDRFEAICDVCNVDFYPDKDLPFSADPDTDAPVIGVKGWATHFYHEIERNADDDSLRVVVTGERASEKFETRELNANTVQALFDEANAWCQARGDGEFRVLRNDIEPFIERVSQ
jgi:hypothetical protein